MLTNYKKDYNDVISQVDRNIFKYDSTYVSQYNKMPVENMSFLRLGNIIGSIGRCPTSILDVGYGNGSFLRTCSNIIPKCFGHDISGYPLPDGCEFADNLFDNHYDVVTFFDSLEHFDDPYFLEKLNCNFICISLPWCHYFSDDWFANWKHRKPNEHLWHFDEVSITKFMKSQKYSVLNITNIEDAIRKHDFNYQNILTGVFSKDLQ